jgi:hypothetical protein
VQHFLRENKLYRKLSKCSVYQTKIHYLGHIISGEGIVVDPTKVEDIMEWPAPTNTQEVCIFMGLASYYQRFIDGFSKIKKYNNETSKEEQEICMVKEMGGSIS